MADDARLIAVVEANTKAFENAMKRLEGVTKNSTDRMTASVKKLDQQVGLVGASFNKLGKALTFTAAISAAKQLASAFADTTKQVADLVDAANKIGISATKLEALRFAFEQSGVGAEQLDSALSKLQKGLADAKAGSGDLRKLLLANGMKEAEIQSLSLEKALDKVADLVRDSTDAITAAKVATLAFGKSADEMVNPLRQGAAGVKGMTDEFMKLAPLTDEQKQLFSELDDQLTVLATRWDIAKEHMALYFAELVIGIANMRKQGWSFGLLDPLLPAPTSKGSPGSPMRVTLHSSDLKPLPRKATVIPSSGGGSGGGGGGGATFGGEVRQLQASVAATRKLALDRELESILEAASKKAGVIVEVTSGGQAAIGTGGPRTGSTRHDLGRAADLRLRDPVTGQILDANNPADLARIKGFLAASAGAGATGIGFGAGYMGTRTMHVGMGKQATWGGAPWLAGTVAAGRANPMFVAGREDARIGAAAEKSQKLADNFEKAQQNALEAADATLKINDALTNANQAFKRDLVGGFIRDLEHGVKPAEALANALQKISDRLLDMALNAIFPDVGSGIIGAVTGLAGGGVMTSRGPMPLRKYAGGGVAHSPQLAMFGEGGRPEAYVPLPDGRRIPVNIRMPGMGGLGGGRGGQAVAVHNRVSIDPSPLFLTTTTAIARQGGRDAVVEASDHSRRRPGGR